MGPHPRQRPGRWTSLTAVGQVILLLTTLLAAPALVIAQDAGPDGATPSPAADASAPDPGPSTGDPGAADPAARKPSADPGQNAPSPGDGQETQPQADVVTAPQALRLFPRQLDLRVGGTKVVRAFTCDAADRSPFGLDRKPGTPDDSCQAVAARWSARDAGVLSFSFRHGEKTRVSLVAGVPTKLVATAGDLTARLPVRPLLDPAAPAADPASPPAEPVTPPADEATAAPSDAPAEPPADTPDDGSAVEPSAAPEQSPVAEASTPPATNGGNGVVVPVASGAPDQPPGSNGQVEPVAPPTEPPAGGDDGQTGPNEPRRGDGALSGDPAAFDSPFQVAASVPVLVETRMANHSGQSGTAGNCITYSPQDGSQPRTIWVDASDVQATAWTAHGRSLSGGTCPASLSISEQSAVGFSPTNATQLETGTPFLLGLMTHSNNPIQVVDQFFPGDLGVRFFGTTLSFPWLLNETPNRTSPASNPANDDFITFQNTVGSQSITVDGIEYQLVLLGFRQRGTGPIGGTAPSCPVTPSGDPINEFRTVEGTQSYACLYGELVQVRPLTIQKVAADGSAPPFPAFDFSSTSDLLGSQWSGQAWTLQPGSSFGPRSFLPSREDVSVTEAAEPGWALQSVVCRNGNGTELTGYSVNLAQGRVVLGDVPDVAAAAAAPITCTFTNAARPASLTLIKSVVNDNGATAVPADFQASIDGTNVDWETAISLPAGSHSASEAGLPGYTAGSWGGDCAADGSITLAPGQDATCSITNDDAAPSLTLVKSVVNDNGGTATAADFSLSADGPTPISGAGGATSDATFAAGTYTLSETDLPGYAAGDWSCVGGAQVDAASVTIALGEAVTCTIVNDDAAPSLTLVKEVVNDDGGTATAADFTLTADGPTPISGAGGATSGPAFAAGTYGLSETTVANYSAGEWTCEGGGQLDGSSLSIALGETVTCTIVNDDILVVVPSLVVQKSADRPIVDIKGEDVTFTYSLTNTSPFPVTIESLDDDRFGNLAGDDDCQVGTVLAAGAACSFEASFLVKPDFVADPPQDTPPHVNVFTACILGVPGQGVSDETACADVDATVGFIGGRGRTPTPSPQHSQPPTDMLMVAASDPPSGPLDGPNGWILWIAMSATLIVSAGWVVRRQRLGEI
jgi:hypothetical protein